MKTSAIVSQINSVFYSIFIFILLTMVFTACEKEPIEQPANTGEQFPVTDSAASNLKSAMTNYFITPSVGSYVLPGAITLNLNCGTYYGTTIRAKVLSKTGSQIKLEISRADGANFSAAGTAFVKAASPCGGIAGSTAYAAGTNKVTVTFNATFSTGAVHFYPTVVSSNGSKYYAEPVLVYTSPMYLTASSFGALQGVLDGVSLYYNPNGYVGTVYYYYNGINTGLKWQCVEFVNRYYLAVYNMNIRISGTNANQYYGTASQRGLVAYPNGGSTAPRVGDLFCMAGGSGGYGHVAIIMEVASNYIKVGQQNGGGNAPIGYSFSKSGNTVTGWSGYTVQGWLRRP
jgi:hypothetical protein